MPTTQRHTHTAIIILGITIIVSLTGIFYLLAIGVDTGPVVAIPSIALGGIVGILVPSDSANTR